MSTTKNKYCEFCEDILTLHDETDCFVYQAMGYKRIAKLFNIKSVCDAIDPNLLIEDEKGSWFIPIWLHDIYMETILYGVDVSMLLEMIRDKFELINS